METSECRAYNALVHHQTIISAKLLVGQCQVCNATAVTPNIPESEALSGRKIASRADVREVARQLSGTYGCAVLVKDGTHLGEFCFKGIGEEGDVEIGYGIDVVVGIAWQ